MYRLALVVLLVIGLIGCSGGDNGSEPVTRAAKASENYDFLKADSLLRAQIKTDSTAKAPYLAGVNKERQLMLWDALEYYLEALTRDVKYAPGYAGMSRVFSLLGSPILAADAARTNAELSGTDLDAWVMSANAYIDAGQFGEAQRALAQAQTAGLASDAAALIKARMEFLRHEYQAAETDAATPVTTLAGSQALARYLEVKGWTDSAAAVSRGIFEEESSHDALVEYFFRALRTGRLYDARTVIAEMRKRDKSDILPRVAEIFYYDHIGEYAIAREASMRLAEVQPVALSTYAYMNHVGNRAVNLSLSGTAGDELMAYIAVNKVHPIVAQYAVYRRIVPRVRMMASPAAVIALDSVSMIPMRSEVEWQAWYAFALETARNFNNVGDSLPTFAQFTSAWNEHPALWTAFAATRMGFSPLKAIQAESLLTKILAKDQYFKPAFDSLWVMYRFVGEFGKAAEIFGKYPHFAEIYPVAGLQQAIALAESGRVAEAVTAAERVLPKVGGNQKLMDLLARALVRAGGGPEAAALLDKALAADPKNPDLLMIAARVACDIGDCKKALEFAEQGLKIEPKNQWLVTEKARATFDTGDQEAGLKALNDELNASPFNAQALIYLSRRMAQLNQNAAQAQDLGRQAIIAAPLPLRATINMAYVYELTGRHDLARGAANMALQVYPNDAEAYYLLGRAMYNEKKPEAKENLLKAVQFGVKGDALRDAQAMLQRM